MKRRNLYFSIAAVCGFLFMLALGSIGGARAQEATAGTWRFAASGDSRNCGDVVMPGIAASVREKDAAFYWHLGDFRAIYKFDEDIEHQPAHIAKPLTIRDYEAIAWDDFIENQILPFRGVPVFLGIGNHETTPPKTREDYRIQFADWLEAPVLREQRLRDDPHDFVPKTYYHWIERGVDFINLDNATPDEFDAKQVAWIEQVLRADASNPEIHTIVAGMHEALPESISEDHSMNESAAGIASGRRVYAGLLKAQNEAHKRVYVLASHSHYYMEGVFNTDYWRTHGGVLPGWIVGTAGAVRYALPKDHSGAREAETNVYGYLLGTVQPDGEIGFAFEKLNETNVPASVTKEYTPQFVHWCFVENSNAK
jgi:hypothetical protein